MNRQLPIVYLILISTFFFGCGEPKKEGNEEKASASSLSLHGGDEKYVVVDTKESIVAWKGSMLSGVNSHTGYVHISKGELMVDKGQLTGGTIEVDMNTIEDEKHESDNKLINHLKDPDFFDVKKFPFSAISITKVTSIDDKIKEVTGNLTIKGITHEVSFPAEMEIKDGIMKANGKLVIDRTKWDVRYKSGKFYALLADQTMSDSIEFTINIAARK